MWLCFLFTKLSTVLLQLIEWLVVSPRVGTLLITVTSYLGLLSELYTFILLWSLTLRLLLVLDSVDSTSGKCFACLLCNDTFQRQAVLINHYHQVHKIADLKNVKRSSLGATMDHYLELVPLSDPNKKSLRKRKQNNHFPQTGKKLKTVCKVCMVVNNNTNINSSVENFGRYTRGSRSNCRGQWQLWCGSYQIWLLLHCKYCN